jgi:O-antigen ligase
LLIFSLFIHYSRLSVSQIQAADLVSVVLILSYLSIGVLRGEISINKSPLDKSIFLLLIAFAVSLIRVVDPFLGLKVYLRHIHLFLLFYVLSSSVTYGNINKLLHFYVGVTLLHSLYNIFQFISSAGVIRAFGITGVPFSDLAVASILICYAYYLLQRSQKSKLIYGSLFLIIFCSLIITQTRGAMLSCLLGYTFLSFIALKKAKNLRLSCIRHNLFKLTSLTILLSVFSFILFPSLFSGVSHRVSHFYQLPFEGPIGTIEIRLVLWMLSLQAFLSSPIIGIGLGQLQLTNVIFPSARFLPLYHLLIGGGAHNIALSYLAETGIIGFLALLFFFFSILKLARSIYLSATTIDDLPISMSLLGILFFVVASSFYAGSWFWGVNGIEFMFFLALAVIFHRKLCRKDNIDDNKNLIMRGENI